jgi:hypothetical protein
MKPKVHWTDPYCGMRYIKNAPKNIHISLREFHAGNALVMHIDLDAKKHLGEGNFTQDKQFFGTFEEAKAVAESWL